MSGKFQNRVSGFLGSINFRSVRPNFKAVSENFQERASGGFQDCMSEILGSM